MEKQFLLPHKYQRYGWIAFFSGFMGFTLLLILAIFIFPWQDVFTTNGNYKPNTYNKVLLYSFLFVVFLIFTGTILIAISREKTEDEYISQLRVRSFLNAILYTFIWLNAFNFFLGSEYRFLSLFKWSFINVVFFYVFDFQLRLNYSDYWNKVGRELKNLFSNAK